MKRTGPEEEGLGKDLVEDEDEVWMCSTKVNEVIYLLDTSLLVGNWSSEAHFSMLLSSSHFWSSPIRWCSWF